MSRKQDRSTKADSIRSGLLVRKPAPKVLDNESRKRQLRHHLDSLERDNFVALNEYEAIIATAAAAATAQGPISLTHTNLDPLGLLPPLSPAAGSIVGGIGTVGPGAATTGSKPPGPLSGSRSKKTQLGNNSSIGSHLNSGGTGGTNSSPASMLGHRKPALPRKPLSRLLDESGLMNVDHHHTPTYLTVSMGPSQYPDRQFCSVCGWKGMYRCRRCGMRYCDLKCLKTHVDTRCMKFTI